METNTHSGTWRIANYHNMVYTADERQLTAKATILQIVIPSELLFSSHWLVGKSLSQLVLPGWCVKGGGLNALLNFFSHSENRALIKKKIINKETWLLFKNRDQFVYTEQWEAPTNTKNNLFYSINRDKDPAIPSGHEKHRLFSDIRHIFSKMVHC